MKGLFKTTECEEVRSSVFLVQRYKKHEKQMKGYAVELKVRDWQMNVWTSWACVCPYACMSVCMCLCVCLCV